MTLRTPETEEAYTRYRKGKDFSTDCFICKKSISIGKYWQIMPNEFPYDAIASEHYVISTKEHTPEMDRNAYLELQELKKEFNYDQLIENSTPSRSAPAHYHLHMVKLK